MLGRRRYRLLEAERPKVDAYGTLIKEAARQLTICNACRYCEGFCPVWEVIEYRREFKTADVEYVANLCHDCGQCFDVCPYTPPNEFSVDIPKILGVIRTETYKKYSTPRKMSLFSGSRIWPTLMLFGFSLLTLFIIYLSSGNYLRIFRTISGPGSFYVILSNAILDIAGTLILFFVVLVWLISGKKFLREVGGPSNIGLYDLTRAFFDSFGEKWFRGGGAGCNYPHRDERGSYKKMVTHSLVLYGFLLDLLATISAFVEQDFFHVLPPYPVLSMPVISGIAGGVMLIMGASLFLFFDYISSSDKGVRMTLIDRTFLVALLLTAFTGLLVLGFRNTSLMGTLLLIHLAMVSVLFISAPYGKFVHLVYRFISIGQYHLEKRLHGE